MIHPFCPYAKVSAHHTQHLLGLLASTTSVLPHAWLKMHSLQAWYLSQFDPLMDRPTKCLYVIPELTKSANMVDVHASPSSGSSLLAHSNDGPGYNGPSPTCWGAHCGPHKIHALWSRSEKLLHINHLEMLVVIKAFCAFYLLIVGQRGHRQHHDHVLYEQARRHPLIVIPILGDSSLGMVL